MPKMKTHKGAKQRFHLTGTGKLLRTKGPKSHLRRKRSKRVKRLFGAKVPASNALGKKVKRFLYS